METLVSLCKICTSNSSLRYLKQTSNYLMSLELFFSAKVFFSYKVNQFWSNYFTDDSLLENLFLRLMFIIGSTSKYLAIFWK